MQIIGFGLARLLLLPPVCDRPVPVCRQGASALALLTVALGVGDHPPRSLSRSLVLRARTINRALLTSPLLRPVYLAGWIPNGLVVGCESLFVPLAGRAAGYLYAATAAGMLTGDTLVGRFIPAPGRRRLVEPLRFLLAAPYVLFLTHPPLLPAAGSGSPLPSATQPASPCKNASSTTPARTSAGRSSA